MPQMSHREPSSVLCPLDGLAGFSSKDLLIHLEKHTVAELARVLWEFLLGTRNAEKQEVAVEDDDVADDVEDDTLASSETSVVATKKLTKGKARRKEKKNLTCETCHKSFSCTGNLNKHRVRHSSVKPWVCGTCGAGFNQRRDLDAHNMQRHTGERPHKCKLCGKGFVYKSYLSEHMDYHTGDRRHQCHRCGKRLSSSSALAKHVARHRTRRDFSCDRCDKSFVVRHDLKAHVKFVHEKAGDSDDIPVFPAKSGSGVLSKDLVPPNYAVVSEEEEIDMSTSSSSSGFPLYQKPRPALRMIVGTSQQPSSSTQTVTTRAMTRQKADQLIPLFGDDIKTVEDLEVVEDEEQKRKRLREMESQRQIEEWMIAEGVSFGPPTVVDQQQQMIPLKIPVIQPQAQSQPEATLQQASERSSNLLPIPSFTTLLSLKQPLPAASSAGSNLLSPNEVLGLSSFVRDSGKRDSQNKAKKT